MWFRLFTGTIFFIFSFFALLVPTNTLARFNFGLNLYLGVRSDEVLELQKMLNQDTRTQVSVYGVGSPGLETTYFGIKTKDAVMRFQEIYRSEILAPGGFLYPTGYVGAQTRAKLNSVTLPLINTVGVSQNILPTTNVISKFEISSVFPTSFTDGDKVEITGNGFSITNRISLAIAPDEDVVGNSNNGKNISVVIRTNIGAQIRKNLSEAKNKSATVAYPLLFDAMQKTFDSTGLDGIYTKTFLIVKNTNGTSNAFPVTIKMASK